MSERLRHVVQLVVLALSALCGVVLAVIGLTNAEPVWLKNAYPEITLGILGIFALDLMLEHWTIKQRMARFEATDTERNIMELNTPHRATVREAVVDFKRLLDIARNAKATNPGFAALSENLLRDQKDMLASLATGRVIVPVSHSAFLHHLMIREYKHSLEAVSEDDLSFWLDRSRSGAYLEATAEAVRHHGMQVARIFIVSELDLQSRLDDIAKVLTAQSSYKFGWGLAVFEDLEYAVRHSERPLDFALYNEASAVSFWRKREPKRFEAVFSVGDNSRAVLDQRQLFEALIAECWLVNSRFRARFPATLPEEVKSKITRVTQTSDAEVKDMVGKEPEEAAFPFFLLANSEADIPGKLKELADIFAAMRAKRGFAAIPPALEGAPKVITSATGDLSRASE